MTDPWSFENSTPIVILAWEVGSTPDAVERRLKPDVGFNPIGARCVPNETAYDFIAECRAREAAQRERERERREEIAAQSSVPQTRERLRKLGEAQARQFGPGKGGMLREESKW